MESCRECNSAKCLEYQQTSGYRERPSYVFYQRAYGIVRSACNKNLPASSVEALKEHLNGLWESQGGKCFYTDEPMALTGYPHPESMTVDRLEPVKGYVVGNVVLCRSLVNRSKQDMSWTEFTTLCRTVLDNEKRVQKLLRKTSKGS